MRNYIVERDHNPHISTIGKFVASEDGLELTDDINEAFTFFDGDAHDLADKLGDFHATAIK